MLRTSFILLISVLMVFPACKKGDDDPAFSLRTRKNRLTGTWTLSEYEFVSDFGKVRSKRYAPDTGMIYTLDDSVRYTRGYTYELLFKGDGTYSYEIREQFPADSGVSGEAFIIISKEEGTWKFTGGNDVPLKSELLVQTVQISKERTDQGSNIDIQTIENPVDGKVYTIDQLSNKSLWLSYSVVRQYPFYEETESVVMKFDKSK